MIFWSDIATHKDGWKNGKHAEQWTTTLQTYVYPIFKDTPVAAVDDEDIVRLNQAMLVFLGLAVSPRVQRKA